MPKKKVFGEIGFVVLCLFGVSSELVNNLHPQGSRVKPQITDKEPWVWCRCRFRGSVAFLLSRSLNSNLLRHGKKHKPISPSFLSLEYEDVSQAKPLSVCGRAMHYYW